MPKRVAINVRKPLLDKEFQQLPSAKKIVDKLADESTEFDLFIHVDSLEMVYTALSLSMSKRPNVECHAHIGEFPGNHYVYSYLSGSHFSTVNFTGQDVSNG